jgi:hypothetical protein
LRIASAASLESDLMNTFRIAALRRQHLGYQFLQSAASFDDAAMTRSIACRSFEDFGAP